MMGPQDGRQEDSQGFYGLGFRIHHGQGGYGYGSRLLTIPQISTQNPVMQLKSMNSKQLDDFHGHGTFRVGRRESMHASLLQNCQMMPNISRTRSFIPYQLTTRRNMKRSRLQDCRFIAQGLVSGFEATAPSLPPQFQKRKKILHSSEPPCVSTIYGGFPKLGGYPFGSPNNKDYSILGSILGSPNFGKLPYVCQLYLQVLGTTT